MSSAVTGVTKKEATKPVSGKQKHGIDIIESAPQEQTNNDNLTCVDDTHKIEVIKCQH